MLELLNEGHFHRLDLVFVHRAHTVKKNQEKSIVLKTARKSHEKSGNFAKT